MDFNSLLSWNTIFVLLFFFSNWASFMKKLMIIKHSGNLESFIVIYFRILKKNLSFYLSALKLFLLFVGYV